ncbi:uncharacterized protein [Palaemon carinicauda]|uniref:uncharacterized protein n=1 Tax=Palaemon carinicauda TaxID=392227 RepID=UPI0035B69265
MNFTFKSIDTKMSGAIILCIALLVGGINTPAVLAVINNILYHSVGEVTEGISDTFALYDGVPKIRCLAICSEKKCPIVAWGAGSSGSGHCRVLSGAAVSTNIAITLSATAGTLTVYVPISSSLTFVQKPYALLLHIAGSYSWSQMRINCRNKGIGLYTPMSSSIIGDLFGTYGNFWTENWARERDQRGLQLQNQGVPIAPGPPGSHQGRCPFEGSQLGEDFQQKGQMTTTWRARSGQRMAPLSPFLEHFGAPHNRTMMV